MIVAVASREYRACECTLQSAQDTAKIHLLFVMLSCLYRDTLLETFLPPLTLQPPVRFSQALIAKRMATSVKLTKNISLARSSPMSHYLAAKGSTAWETSVKERKETVEDDVPVGWRIIEKATPATVQGAKEKKASGGLFSFWGRRQSQQAQVSNEAQGNSRASSLDKPQSPALEEANGGSRRPSQDSLRSLANSREVQLPSPSSEPSSSQTIPDPPTIMSSYATASDPVPERSSTPPAPSAVSRFLNKFSRRSSVGGSPRSSLALSSDDIEFLSDTVPSAADDADDGTTDALEKFVSAKRESVVLALPPPLAPPPRASPTLRPSSTVHNPHSTGSKAGSPTSDLEALFGSLGSWNAPTTSSVLSATGPSQTVIPPLAPPLVPSRSATPAGASGSGLSKPTAIMSSGALTSSRPPSRLQTSTPPLAGFALPPPPSFEPITSIKPSKPKLASPFPLPQGSASPAEPGPMSASSTSSYATAAESSSRSSPPSPTSSLPLGELYPHLVTPTTPPQPSAQAFFPSGMPRGFHTMSSATSTTPLASTFPSSPAPPLLRPQMQSTNAISPTAAPLKSDFFDEDFSDFQSPVMEHLSDPSPSAPSPIAKSPQTLTAARAANASRAAPVRSQTVPNSTHIAFPQPPLPAKSYKPPSMPPLQTLASFDDDDFADFQTSPRSPQNMQPSSNSTLFSNSMSDKALLTPKNSMSFSGFNDLIGGGSLATPSPPRVPAKPIPPLRPPSVPSLQPPPVPALQPHPVPALQPHPAVPPAFQPPPTPAPSPSMSASTLPSASSSSSLLARRESKKRSHAADHLHTLNLMEKAAAKSGQRWPAPLSPLPAIIPGPSGATGKGAYFDIMDEDAPTPATQPVPALVPSSSSPAALNPAGRPSGMGVGNTNGVPANGMSFMALNPTTSSSNGSLSNSLLQGWDSSFSSFQGASSPPKASSPDPPFVAPGMPANGKVVQGGLSAQDLLFFEGL